MIGQVAAGGDKLLTNTPLSRSRLVEQLLLDGLFSAQLLDERRTLARKALCDLVGTKRRRVVQLTLCDFRDHMRPHCEDLESVVQGGNGDSQFLCHRIL